MVSNGYIVVIDNGSIPGLYHDHYHSHYMFNPKLSSTMIYHIYNYVYIYMYSTWLTIINPVSSTKKNEHYYPLNTNLPYIY